jgi:hypothetical protein
MPDLIDLTGQIFGRLVVLRRGASAGKEVRWECRCECGAKCICHSAALRKGRTRSCGCLQREVAGRTGRTHGMCGTGEYQTWRAMIRRCCDPKFSGYERYGARGITVCDRWKTSFENFIEDVGLRPSANHTIDRYPNNKGNYEPGNCRWATRSEQANNNSRTCMVEYRGQVIALADAISLSGTKFKYRTILRRVRVGWSVEDALNSSVRRRAA